MNFNLVLKSGPLSRIIYADHTANSFTVIILPFSDAETSRH